MKEIDAVIYAECYKQYIPYAVIEGAVCTDKPPVRFRCAYCHQSTNGQAFRSVYIKSDIAGKRYFICGHCFKEERLVLKRALQDYKNTH